MNYLAAKYLASPKRKKKKNPVSCSRNVFAASAINQKIVNQNTQQMLTLIAAQLLNIIEAQFSFTTNDDEDFINF